MAKLLSALPVGSVVKSTNTKYNGKVIRWIVGTQDTANGRTGLVAEKMITLKCFDAKEPSNTNSDRRSYGNNRYSQSNIDQWLNSQAASWYSARHSYDAPPSNANVWSNYNEYDTEAGFLSNFEADFRNAILDAVIRVAKNTVTDGGGYEDITRKIFLLSNTEVGLTNENSVAEGTLWSYFSSAARRQCYPTAEAVSNSEYTSSSLNASSYWWWWPRTPYASYAYCARNVSADGSLNNTNAYYGDMAFGRLCIWNLEIWYPIQQTPTGPISYSGTSRRLLLLLFPTAHHKPETAWSFRRAVLPIRRATPFPTSGKGRLIPAPMSS